MKKTERNAQIVAYYKSNQCTQQACADHFGLTRQRVQAILKRAGLNEKSGGLAKEREKRRKQAPIIRERAKDRIARKRFGMDAQALAQIDVETRKAYVIHRKNSIARGIRWRISFPDWLALWQASGKFELRGRGIGKWIMTTIDSRYPLTRDNARIVEFIKSRSLPEPNTPPLGSLLA